MKAKKFYIELSTKLHADRDQAVAKVVAIEKLIDENIRMINVATDIGDQEPVAAVPAVKVVSKKV
jgi:hypothetical protein